MTLPGLLLACACMQADGGEAPSPPRGMRQIYENALAASEESGEAASPESQFWLSAPSEWSYESGIDDNGVGEPAPDAGPCLAFKSGKSYQPRVRSPHSLALLKGYPLRGDFVFEVEAMQTGIETAHRDLVLVFGFESAERYFYAHLGMVPDATSSNVFEVNRKARARIGEIGEKRIEWGRGVWHRLRVECIDRMVRVYWDGAKEPHFEKELRRRPAGLIGFGSFDDAGAFRNLRIFSRQSTSASRKAGAWRTSPFGGTAACEALFLQPSFARRGAERPDGSLASVRYLRVLAGRTSHRLILADVDGDGQMGSPGDRWAFDDGSPEIALKTSTMVGVATGLDTRDDLVMRPLLDDRGRWREPFQVTLEFARGK